MRDFPFSMKRLCKKNRDGSFATMAAREKALIQAAKQLEELGFKGMKSPHQLKPKHVHALVQKWNESGITTATIKNRLSHLRWISRVTNNRSLMAKSNEHYGIAKRIYVNNEDKSTQFESHKLSQLRDSHVKASAQLQREFGLRREEAMKFIPQKADKGTHIELQGSWTKGGKPRSIPIRTDSQREALEHAHQVANRKSLIPVDRSYIQHVRVFEKEMHRVGLGKTHGARHLYAMTRYQELTGRVAPVLGGATRQSLSAEERIIDDQARLEISRELGHERRQIIAIYIGS